MFSRASAFTRLEEMFNNVGRDLIIQSVEYWTEGSGSCALPPSMQFPQPGELIGHSICIEPGQPVIGRHKGGLKGDDGPTLDPSLENAVKARKQRRPIIIAVTLSSFFSVHLGQDPYTPYPPFTRQLPPAKYNRRSSADSGNFGDPRFQEASCYPFGFSVWVYIEWQRDPIVPRAGIQCAWLQFIVNFSWIRGGNGTIYTTSNGGSNPQTNNGSIIHDNSIPAGNDLVIEQREHYTSGASEQVPSTSRPAAQIHSVHYRADSVVPPETAKGQSPPPEPPPESMTASQGRWLTQQLPLTNGYLTIGRYPGKTVSFLGFSLLYCFKRVHLDTHTKVHVAVIVIVTVPPRLRLLYDTSI
ncbi:hypothetical protein VNI00_015366 [Paramarasmius palmivorus]|uniref:Uncharacterized protein n=1 Tax=Paramarasmius palmivorus TaxID=297713 RepID=A0AAW0BKA0_9AGAR